jgi:anti-anti-sigma factor
LFEMLVLPVKALTVDLAGLTFIDSSGLSVLAAGREAARERGIVFSLARLPEQARRVLEVTGMIDTFELDPEPDEPTTAA